MIYSRDTPFWQETPDIMLEIHHCGRELSKSNLHFCSFFTYPYKQTDCGEKKKTAGMEWTDESKSLPNPTIDLTHFSLKWDIFGCNSFTQF